MLERLRETIEHLARIERPSASEGEREAAEWIRDRLAAVGADARVETGRAHGTYWWPLAACTGAAALAGAAAPRPVAAVVAAAATAGVAEDVSAGPHLLRKVLPQRDTYNVVAEAGDRTAEHTVVFVAHHDAAHGGLIFRRDLLTLVADRFPGWFARQQTSPRAMALVAAGPALVTLGALTGSRGLRRTGTALSLGSVGAFLDIALRKVVPGANDNLSAVAVLIELARRLHEQPPRGLRVLLVSTGSEESFMEGMRAFGRRHFPDLPRERTEIITLDSVGSPELVLIEGEGMLVVRDYPDAVRERVAAAAAHAQVHLRRGLRLGFATDGLIALRAGYPCATIGSVDEYKFPSNYHSPDDVPENLTYETIRDAVLLCDAYVRQSAASARARSSASSRVESSPA